MYYGIRFFGGRFTTTGTPNLQTGHYSIACDIQVFRSKEDRDEWVSNEDLYAPSGLGGGERIAATKKQCRDCRLGSSIADFEAILNNAELDRYL